jgi:hypothetical protein
MNVVKRETHYWCMCVDGGSTGVVNLKWCSMCCDEQVDMRMKKEAVG